MSVAPLSKLFTSPRLRSATCTSPLANLPTTILRKSGCFSISLQTAAKPDPTGGMGDGGFEIEESMEAVSANERGGAMRESRRRRAVAGREMLMRGSVAVASENRVSYIHSTVLSRVTHR